MEFFPENRANTLFYIYQTIQITNLNSSNRHSVKVGFVALSLRRESEEWVVKQKEIKNLSDPKLMDL